MIDLMHELKVVVLIVKEFTDDFTACRSNIGLPFRKDTSKLVG